MVFVLLVTSHKTSPHPHEAGPHGNKNMSRRNINLSNDEYYHIYNRGNSKQIIFLDDHDKYRFMKLLLVMNQENRKNLADISKEEIFVKPIAPLVAIDAYVIMDNHYHILLQQLQADGVTKFMQKVGTAYASYFNKKYKRMGSLYEGRFKAKHVTTDTHLKYLLAYIHLNPAKMINKNWKNGLNSKEEKNEILLFLKNYKFSSFHDYLGIKRQEKEILTITNAFLDFKDSKLFLKNILVWFSSEEDLGLKNEPS